MVSGERLQTIAHPSRHVASPQRWIKITRAEQEPLATLATLAVKTRDPLDRSTLELMAQRTADPMSRIWVVCAELFSPQRPLSSQSLLVREAF